MYPHFPHILARFLSTPSSLLPPFSFPVLSFPHVIYFYVILLSYLFCFAFIECSLASCHWSVVSWRYSTYRFEHVRIFANGDTNRENAGKLDSKSGGGEGEREEEGRERRDNERGQGGEKRKQRQRKIDRESYQLLTSPLLLCYFFVCLYVGYDCVWSHDAPVRCAVWLCSLLHCCYCILQSVLLLPSFIL